MLNNRVLVVAEVKTHSPFGWKSEKSWEELFQIANGIGDVLSIHTEKDWHGSMDLVRKAKSLTNKPILAKGVHPVDEDIEKALEAGADYVLVVGRIPKIHLDKCWLEPVNLQELKSYPEGSKVVWNTRDLNTGNPKIETFMEARQLWDGWLAQASNIVTIDDVDPLADAVIVGTHLQEFAESLAQKPPQ